MISMVERQKIIQYWHVQERSRISGDPQPSPDSKIAIVFFNHSRRDVELFKMDNDIKWPTIYVSENDESHIRNVLSPFALVADSKLESISYLFVSNSKISLKSENYFNFIINNWDLIESQYEKINH